MHSEINIEHKGIIVDIVGERIDVAMEVSEGCGACRVKEICGMGGSETKIVSTLTPVPQIFSQGEQVVVEISKAMGVKAVIYAYILPFFILFGSVLGLLEAGAGEVVSGLSALGAVAVYYVGLYFMRDRIEREIVFKIRKCDE